MKPIPRGGNNFVGGGANGMVFVMSFLLHQQASRLHISFWTRSAIPILFEITIPIPIGSHPSQCYSSRSRLKFKVPMEHNCENSKLTLLCWFRNMQITFLRAFRQYQNQSGRAHYLGWLVSHFVHVPTWHYKPKSHNKSFIIQEMDFKMCRK
jgi:hypothetical protein